MEKKMDREALKSVFKNSLNVTDYQANIIAMTLEQYITDEILNRDIYHWSPTFVSNSNNDLSLQVKKAQETADFIRKYCE